jgi:hypothetical protein
VGHDARPGLAPYHPVHVTLRFAPFIESLRFGEPPEVVRGAVREQRDRSGMWIVEYSHSLQDDHLHMPIEALGRRALSRGMQGH